MKLTAVQAVTVQLPRPSPVSAARRPAAASRNVRVHPINKYREFSRARGGAPGAVANDFWVRVVAEDGSWGIGPGSGGRATAALVDDHFAPLLVGRDCLAIELLADLMWRSSQRQGPGGLISVARSAVDLALWDLKGKLLGQPVYSLLGGPVRETIPVYCTSDDVDWSMELGFDQFKISNPAHYDDGIAGLDAIEEHVGQARQVIGPGRELMLNPVMSFNVEYTRRVAERIRPYQLRWLEEPLVPGDIAGHEQLRHAIPWLPLATGEDHYGRDSFRELLERRCVDVIQPDIRRCGGLSELLKIYHLAEAFGVITVPHYGANEPYGQHFACAAPESPVAEYWMGSAPGIPLSEVNPLPGVPVPENGRLRPSDAPGFGLDIAEAWIEPFW